jgi:hypothetical protein
MVYDDMSLVYLSGNVDFKFKENISFGGWLTYNVFNTKVQKLAWHTPNLEANVYAKATFFNDKLGLRSDLFLGSQVNFITIDKEIKKSNALFDLNVSAEYHFTEKISLMVKGINLLDNRFERWYGYPSVGINGMVMVKVIF